MSDKDEYGIYSGDRLADEIEKIIHRLRALTAYEAADILADAVEVLRLQQKFMTDKRSESELRIELESQLAVVKRWESISDRQLDMIAERDARIALIRDVQVTNDELKLWSEEGRP